MKSNQLNGSVMRTLIMAAIIDETLLIKEIRPRFSCFLPV